MNVTAFLRMLYKLLLEMIIAIFREPWSFLKFLCHFDFKRLGEQEVPCLPLPHDILRKPDPLIYSQSYIASLGMAVVWDNPDMTLLKNGVPVDAHQLNPDTDYDVAIRVHNGSNEAPAFGINVRLSYHRWGVGGPWHFVAETLLDLPVRGAPGEPATVILGWHTPMGQAGPSHWCLDVELQYPDDLNPLNNIGQDNVDIRRAIPGEHVSVDIPVIHQLPGQRALHLQMTSYALPAKPLYPPVAKAVAQRYEQAIARLGDKPLLADVIAANRVTGVPPIDNWTAYRSVELLPSDPREKVKQYGQDWLPRIVETNSVAAHPALAAWLPALSAEKVILAANEETSAQLRVTVPQDAQPDTRQRFQVNVFDELTGLVGGVELIVIVR